MVSVGDLVTVTEDEELAALIEVVSEGEYWVSYKLEEYAGEDNTYDLFTGERVGGARLLELAGLAVDKILAERERLNNV